MSLRAAALPLAALLAIALVQDAAACTPDPLRLEKAHFRLGSLGPPPSLDAHGGERLRLPDSWGRSRPGVGGTGWYRLRVELAPMEGGCAVRLPEVNANAAVFVNGRWIGQGGSFAEPVAHNFNRPLLLPFSGSLLRSGENVIDVSVRAYADAVGRLGVVWLGSYATLADIHERDVRRRAGAAQVATAVGVLAVLLAGALWLTMGREDVYGWFVLAVGAWSVASLNFWLRDVPLPHWTWERLVNAALDLAVVFLAIWVRRFLGLAPDRVDRLLLALAPVLVAVVGVAPRSVYPFVVLCTHAVALVLTALIVLHVFAYRARLLRGERLVYLSVAAVGLGLTVRDYGLALDSAHTAPPTLPIAFSLAIAAFVTSLLLRFSRAVRQVGELNASLEVRVRAREAELAQNFERLRGLERREVLTRERERIMRDLHDGLGGRLVSALSRVESGVGDGNATAAILRDALAEMRMVIDSLDPGLADLPSLLAHVRERVEPSLEAAGIRLLWAVEDVPEEFSLGPDQFLDVLRIVQEAITNSVRHAGARSIRVGLRAVRSDGEHRHGSVADQELEIVIEDDGVGVGSAPGEGRGLRNMRERAANLGGRLEIEDREPGLRVRLSLAPSAAEAAQSPSSSNPRFAAS